MFAWISDLNHKILLKRTLADISNPTDLVAEIPEKHRAGFVANVMAELISTLSFFIVLSTSEKESRKQLINKCIKMIEKEVKMYPDN